MSNLYLVRAPGHPSRPDQDARWRTFSHAITRAQGRQRLAQLAVRVEWLNREADAIRTELATLTTQLEVVS